MMSVVCFLTVAKAQVPYIKSISSAAARPQQNITLQGINFGTNASNIKVLFGSVAVTPQTITDQLIEVSVPLGTTYDNLSVVNTSTGATGFSKNPFLLSYGGTNPFITSSVSGQSDFSAESGLYDFAMADFDGDGKTDVATAGDNSTNVALLLNTSTPGSMSFTKSLLSPGVNSFHVSAGDLNGDSKPEILVSEKNGARIFIFKNASSVGTPSFVMQTLTITGAKVSQIKVRDMDLNGKADLVVTDQSSGRFFVIPNTSSLSTIQFGSAISVSLPGSAGVDGIDIGDLNSDGLPDIAITEFLTPLGNISIVQNLSSPGNFNFNVLPIFSPSTTISNLKIGDLDGDGKPDLAATALLANGVFVFKNKSSSSAIALNSPDFFDGNAKPWGIDFGDVDGDGQADIIVASITQKVVTVLNNQSTPGTYSFAKQTLSTTYINRFTKVGDLDNDGRPDIAFTSIDDNNLVIPASKISVFRNLNCVVPVVSPDGPVTVCSNLIQRLDASNNAGATYEWFQNGTSLGAPTSTPYYNVTSTGQYKVNLVNGACSQTSNSVQVTVVSESSLPTATPNPVAPVCINGTMTLSVNNVGASDYVWKGPGSFTANGLSVSRNNFQANQAGKYDLEVMIGTCVTQRASVVVDIVDVPEISVISSGADIICQGQSKPLNAYPSVNGYTYQWAEQTSGNIAGANSSTYNATTSGSYFVKLTSVSNPTCPVVQSSSKTVRVAQIPVVDFTFPATSCTGQPVNFTNQSSLDPDTVGLSVKFNWDFGDSGSSTLVNPSHTFASAQTFSVKLSVSYLSQSCLGSSTKSITPQAAPSLAITTPSGVFTFCPLDSLQLQATPGFDSYAWSNGKNSATTYAKSAGIFSVEATIGGCVITANQTLGQYIAPIVSASASPADVKDGSNTQLTASGLSNYVWQPGATLSDSLISNPIATPPQNITYTVSGKDGNGCTGTATVNVRVTKDNTISTLNPSNFFSPNGDKINDTWQVENLPVQNQCSVIIFDERGFKVFEAKPYSNDWNGVSSRGASLPAGVYYYVMKCDDSPNDFKAGSINIVR